MRLVGREKAYLTSIGRKIENFDMSIGAIALQHKMIMVTDNVDHLGRIRGIEQAPSGHPFMFAYRRSTVRGDVSADRS